MKKIFAILLTLGMLSMVLTGCSGGEDAGTTDETTTTGTTGEGTTTGE